MLALVVVLVVVLVLEMDNGHWTWTAVEIDHRCRAGAGKVGNRCPERAELVENSRLDSTIGGLGVRDGGTYPAGDTVLRYLGEWGSSSH